MVAFLLLFIYIPVALSSLNQGRGIAAEDALEWHTVPSPKELTIYRQDRKKLGRETQRTEMCPRSGVGLGIESRSPNSQSSTLATWKMQPVVKEHVILISVKVEGL